MCPCLSLGQLSLTGTGNGVQCGWEDRHVNIFYSQYCREEVRGHQICQRDVTSNLSYVKKDESFLWVEGQMCAEIKKQNFQEWKDLERIRRDDVELCCLFVF